MANSVDPEQTAHRSSLFWVHTVCFYTYFISNVRQLFAADDLSRQHFEMHFFLGALRVNVRCETTIFQFAQYGKNWTKGADYFRMDGSTNAQNRKASQNMFNDEENFR